MSLGQLHTCPFQASYIYIQSEKSLFESHELAKPSSLKGQILACYGVREVSSVFKENQCPPMQCGIVVPRRNQFGKIPSDSRLCSTSVSWGFNFGYDQSQWDKFYGPRVI